MFVDSAQKENVRTKLMAFSFFQLKYHLATTSAGSTSRQSLSFIEVSSKHSSPSFSVKVAHQFKKNIPTKTHPSERW